MFAVDWSWELDGWIVLTGILCAFASALLGNFLVLRRMSLLGDAISHAVLPGLAVAFLMSGSRSNWPMFLGAVIVGVLTALFTEWIRRIGRVDEGASMGVVFTSLFALGLVLIVQAADHVDLDPGCVLYGAIELTPLDTIDVAGFEIPRAVVMLGIVTVINALFILVFFKELKLTSFDPALATTTGFSSTLMHYLLMILVAVTAVASFESVGNILVVAMFVVPPATAYLLTNRLGWMILLSVILAILSAVVGHWSALVVPSWFGFQSTSTAGMMATVSGLFLGLAVAFAPQQGVIVKWFRRQVLSWSILSEDIIALLYRLEEQEPETSATLDGLKNVLLTNTFSLRAAVVWLQIVRQVTLMADQVHLTERGRNQGRQLVRSHRLWEEYLVSQAGIPTDRIHPKAEAFEHFTDVALRERLHSETNEPQTDPHGSPIPDEEAKQE